MKKLLKKLKNESENQKNNTPLNTKIKDLNDACFLDTRSISHPKGRGYQKLRHSEEEPDKKSFSEEHEQESELEEDVSQTGDEDLSFSVQDTLASSRRFVSVLGQAASEDSTNISLEEQVFQENPSTTPESKHKEDRGYSATFADTNYSRGEKTREQQHRENQQWGMLATIDAPILRQKQIIQQDFTVHDKLMHQNNPREVHHREEIGTIKYERKKLKFEGGEKDYRIF